MNQSDAYACDVLLYLDGELKGQALEAFLVHLASCRVCRTQLEEERELSDLLRRSRPLDTAPNRLRARVIATWRAPVSGLTLGRLCERVLRLLKTSWRSPESPILRWSTVAVVVIVFALGSVFEPHIVQRRRATTFIEAALSTQRSYLDGTLPLEIESDSPEAVTAWFARKVPFDFRLPMLQSAPNGLLVYRQIGARLVNYEGGYAALVTYAKNSEKIGMLVASSKSANASGGEEIRSGGLTFHYHRKAEFNVITWNAHGLTYALVSSLHSSARQSCLVCHQNMADKNEFREHQ